MVRQKSGMRLAWLELLTRGELTQPSVETPQRPDKRCERLRESRGRVCCSW